MNNAQFNRKIKRLSQDWVKLCITPYDNIDVFFKQKEELEEEFKTIYSMDREMKYMNATSLRIMIRLNLIFRVVPFHQFGISIEL